MGIMVFILAIVIVPTQFWVGVLFAQRPQSDDRISAKVEGASVSKERVSVGSFREVLQKQKGSKTALDETGYVPQRKNTFEEMTVSAGSSVVVDVDSGTVLHFQKGRDHLPIASLTKVMTAILVMERVADLNEALQIDKEAISTEGAKVGCPTSVFSECNSERFYIGEKISVKNVLTAMLIDSANDAAIALGKHIAGSQNDFAEMMNEKARSLDLNDSNFCNPSGLDANGCYSSAYDLARIAAYSMKYDLLWKIMNTDEAVVQSVDGKSTHQLKNTDQLLGKLPNCLGGKTGFTYGAGKSLMMAAVDPEIGKHRIVAVVLNDENRWEDMENLIKWTFENYEWK